MEHRVVEPLEGPRAHEQEAAGVDVEGGPAGPFRQLEGDGLVLDQGEQRLLGADAGHVHLAAHVAADLVDLVHEHEAVAGLVHELVHGGRGTELLPGPLEQPAQERFSGMSTLGFLAEDVGMDPDHGRAQGERGVLGEDGLDRAHQRGLARARRADHEDVADPQLRELLGERNRDLADRVLLADDAALEQRGDLRRRRCRAHRAILGRLGRPVGPALLHPSSRGYARPFQAARPPRRGRTRSMPRRLSMSATRALVASSGQVQ